MSVLAPGRNIVLIGLMGAGKTTVGRRLAQRLGRPFADTDAVVETAAGTSVAAIFDAQGERGFRAMEATAVRHVAALRGQVIAVGGGAVLDHANVTHLRSTGDLVFLDGDPAVLAQRVGDAASRPLLHAQPDLAARLAALRTERAAAYDQAAVHVVDTTGRDPDETVEAVLTWARNQPGLLSRDEVTL